MSLTSVITRPSMYFSIISLFVYELFIWLILRSSIICRRNSIYYSVTNAAMGADHAFLLRWQPQNIIFFEGEFSAAIIASGHTFCQRALRSIRHSLNLMRLSCKPSNCLVINEIVAELFRSSS